MGLGVRVGVWVRVRVSFREHARHLLSFESRPRNAHLRRGGGSKAARVDGRRRGRLAKLLLHEAPRVTDVPVSGLGVAFGGLGVAFGGLAGGFEGAGATAQEERRRAGPWLWREWPRGGAAGEGGRRVNRLERTRSPGRRALPVRSAAVPSHACPACLPAPPARASGARCLGRRAARARRAAVPSARRPPAPTGLGLGSGLGSGLGLGLGIRD